MTLGFDYVWRVDVRPKIGPTTLPDRKGQRCRVLASGTKWTSLVEFEDGYRVLTSRRYLRRAP